MKIPYHYFASSAAGYTQHRDLETCLRIQREKDVLCKTKGCNVYRISGYETRHYEVDLYKAVVKEKDREFIALVIYEDS